MEMLTLFTLGNEKKQQDTNNISPEKEKETNRKDEEDPFERAEKLRKQEHVTTPSDLVNPRKPLYPHNPSLD